MQVRVTLFGKTPLMVHSQEGMNPLNKKAQALASEMGKPKTPATLKLLSDLEYQLGLYYDDEIGPYLPAHNVKKCLHDGAKKIKKGPKLLEALRTTLDCQKFPIIYSGERSLEWLLLQEHLRDVRNVRVGKAYVSRTRPIFPAGWKSQGEFLLNDGVLKLADLKQIGSEAGEGVGIGEYNPKHSGEYGTFEFAVEEVER